MSCCPEAAAAQADGAQPASARALPAGPALLICDEPTAAHLDPEARQALTADLLQATEGRSVLLITHQRVGSTRSARSRSSTTAGSLSEAATSISAAPGGSTSRCGRASRNPLSRAVASGVSRRSPRNPPSRGRSHLSSEGIIEMSARQIRQRKEWNVMPVPPWGGVPHAGGSVPQEHATPACITGPHGRALSVVHEQTKAWS